MPTNDHLVIGGLIFPDLDQVDFTGPFEVLSRLPDSEFLVLGKTTNPLRDARGLILTPQVTLAESPALDVLVVPGGAGVNAAMEDQEILAFIRDQAAHARLILSVCTGALLCGAAGLLQGRRATTHWASHQFLSAFGATAIKERVVVDTPFVFAAGVTSGLDGALQAAAILRGPAIAQQIQLYMEYTSSLFPGGSPSTVSADVLAATEAALKSITDERASLIHRLTSYAS